MSTVVVLHARTLDEALSYKEEFPRATYVLSYKPKQGFSKSYEIRKDWVLNLLKFNSITEIRLSDFHRLYTSRYGSYSSRMFSRLIHKMSVQGFFVLRKEFKGGQYFMVEVLKTK